MDATETDDASIVGEAAHIVGDKEDGPRGISSLTQEQRDRYANLLLHCNVHHKQVDDQVGKFTVDQLLALKHSHENWVQHQLGFDAQKLRDDELYADYIEHRANEMRLDDWRNWTSFSLGGQPSLSIEMKMALDQIRPWLLSRVWPGRYPQLEEAFANFRRVAQDFCLTFEKHAEKRDDIEWRTEKFYRIPASDPERYESLFREFEVHVALVEELLLELTRTANYICDRVQENVLAVFRLQEGVLLVTSGPYSPSSFKIHRVEYRHKERTARPYQGLEQFTEARLRGTTGLVMRQKANFRLDPDRQPVSLRSLVSSAQPWR
jgi:hypothetical protein